MEESDEGIDYEELAEENEMNLHALTELLIEKKIITQEELDKKLDELYPDEE